ncbi:MULTISPECIES: endospore germination permease [unclassified Paenibacillus]|uniref:GerAB/ArcD/ProY family transporter n=1 Tax=unclassified Paenibacillus TaxID=185978 RepID=UPI0027898477|nr:MULTISPECIES: endospore germination permease [unclassified Paenibacillus]MDQ0896502.1 spore germination protein (amino acid permease) [Paenibacillus sp. V4I7]MDQ0917390.1 spore germination protein (amino acid permease) [Paenibacillus sp. V4I5]
MNKYSFNQISLIQYIFIIFETQVGIGVLSLPRDVANAAGSDGWISIILGAIGTTLLSLVIIRIMEKNPEYTLFELLSKYFGKWVGKALAAAWILLAVYAASTAMFSTIHIIKIWIIQDIRNFILMILFTIPIYMITKQGIRVIGLFAELVFIVTLWMPVLLFLALKDAQWMYLLPVGKSGVLPILSAVKSTIYSLLGFELAFILYPFLKDKKSASKGIVIANLLSMIIYLTTTIICFIRFSPTEVTEVVYPVLNLLKVIQLPFLERLEIICLTFYLFIIFMTIIPYLYAAVLGTSQLIGKQDHRNALRIILVLWILLSFFFIPTTFQITQMANSWGKAGLYSAFVFPIFLWIYGWIFHFARKEPKQ